MSLNEFVYQDNCPPRKVQEIQEQLLDLEELKSLVKQAGIRDAANEFRLRPF